MGRIYHHVIVVASWDKTALVSAHKKAQEIFDWVSPVSPEFTNGVAAFFVPPDGSKEGWDESLAGDIRRDRFVDYLDDQRFEDGSSVLDWVEVRFGSDIYPCRVTRHDRTDTRGR